MSRQLLFKVISEGRTYCIYDNGEIEGFGSDAVVFNYFPNLSANLVVIQRDQLAAQDALPMVLSR